jgi:hypothetical protein
MGYSFTVADMERICRSLGMSPLRKGHRVWRGIGPDRKVRVTVIHSHGQGRELATGTARQIAKDLLFRDLEGMYQYLQGLG